MYAQNPRYGQSPQAQEYAIQQGIEAKRRREGKNIYRRQEQLEKQLAQQAKKKQDEANRVAVQHAQEKVKNLKTEVSQLESDLKTTTEKKTDLEQQLKVQQDVEKKMKEKFNKRKGELTKEEGQLKSLASKAKGEPTGVAGAANAVGNFFGFGKPKAKPVAPQAAGKKRTRKHKKHVKKANKKRRKTRRRRNTRRR